MSEFASLRPTVKVYVAAVVLVGFGILAHSVHRLYVEPLGTQWVILAALTLLTGSFTVKVPSINAHISVSETFVFASVLLFGASAGAVTVLLECLIINFWIKHGRPVHRILFNITAPAIAIWVSGNIFFLISGIEPYSKQSTPLPGLFLPLLAFTVLYFFLNSSLVAIALGLETDRSPVQIWWKNFTWLSVNYFSGASVAALIVTYTKELDFSTLAVIVPLLVVSYLTFRTAMGRVEDSNKHLGELNKLYLSTIETLAMAIDAKDQITHGHIRRVQGYAVGLAKRVGVTDERLIKAIEAAALLHDMGKLAVPEYILNKPGRLTGAEFEKMKLHASVGADILSAIDFPYPVVPIVRHHHENWDGSGYPDGLKGTDIPIGARILSVVDCFDALTSDRPYRPKLADQEALRILIDRRGSMYDPLIVDTFARVHGEIYPELGSSNLPKHALNEITSSSQNREFAGNLPRFDDISASTDEMITLFELARALAGRGSIADTGTTIVNHLRRLIPFSLSVMYLFDESSDELVAKHATGDVGALTVNLRIARGQRLSGWVAANRQIIVNSDATLDFGEVAKTFHPPLRSCLSAPLVCNDQLVGVLTLYSNRNEGFTDEHRRIIEVVARQVAHPFKSAVESDRVARWDTLTGLPSTTQVEQLLPRRSSEGYRTSPEVALILVDVEDLAEITAKHGSQVSDDALRSVAQAARNKLRAADILFRCGPNRFAVLLNETGLSTASVIAEQIRSSVEESSITLSTGETLAIRSAITCVSSPNPRDSLRELMAAADLQFAARRRDSATQVH